MDVVDQIAAKIKNEDNFIITSHIDPDGDNIASQLALFSLFKILAKHAYIFDQDPVPERYEFLIEKDVIHTEPPENRDYSTVFIVDVANLHRIGPDVLDFVEPLSCKINIDHHRSNEQFGVYNFVDASVCSATVLVYRLIKRLGIEWNKELATRIYTGIMTDTGRFRFQNTNEEALSIAREMVEYGAVPGDIAYHVYSQRPLAVIKLIVETLSTLKLYHHDKIALMKITDEHYEKTNAQPEHSEGLINYASSIKGVYLAILLRENVNNQIRVSLRSNGQVDVDKIARMFGGGGHRNASGCRIEGNMAEVEEKLLQTIKKIWLDCLNVHDDT